MTSLGLVAISFSMLTAAPRPVVGLPPLSPLERTLVTHAKDGRLEGATLLEAALLASGLQEAAIPEAARRVRVALSPAITAAKSSKGEAARGRRLLEALHETVLRKYDIGASELDHVERTGEYNCLSSALLYLIAAEGILETARGVVTPHHAFVRLTIDGRVVDVETTNAEGFNPDRSKLTWGDVKQLVGDAVSPEDFRAGLKQAEELPPLSLVAAVYSNRAIILAKQGNTAASAIALDRGARMATGALQKRLADWRAGLLNNTAKEMVDLGRVEDARRLLELGLEVTEGSHRALLNRSLGIVHHHLGLAAASRKDWAEALSHAELSASLGNHVAGIKELKATSLAQLAALEGSAARCRSEGVKPRGAGAKEAAACLSLLSMELLERDPQTALQYARRAFILFPADPRAAAAIVLTVDRQARAVLETANCDEVEALIAEGLPHAKALAPQTWEGKRLAGICWAQKSRTAFTAGQWEVAARELNRARIFMPDDADLTRSLARVEMNQGIDLANQGACDEARPHVVAAKRGDPELTEKAIATLGNCADRRAAAAAKKGDWASVKEELRRGLRDAPGNPALQKNLATAVYNQLTTLLRAHRCDEARALKSEIDAPDEALQTLMRACR